MNDYGPPGAPGTNTGAGAAVDTGGYAPPILERGTGTGAPPNAPPGANTPNYSEGVHAVPYDPTQ